MKKAGLFIVLFCVSFMMMAQDMIVKKDGTIIQSKVMEINSVEIKYKQWSNMDGPLYSINRGEVLSINYQNGTVEQISTNSAPTPTSYSTPYYGVAGVQRMERDGRDLTLNGRELSDEEIKQLVGEENYETYCGARRQITAARAVAPVFWVSYGITVALATSAFICTMTEEYASAASLYIGVIVTGSVASVTLPVMCVFNGIGKGRMNWVADEYNKSNGVYSYQISPSIIRYNSVESKGNALGLTLTINF
jgi:hypothetical protein